jgi:RNA recognition motif-containing protein
MLGAGFEWIQAARYGEGRAGEDRKRPLIFAFEVKLSNLSLVRKLEELTSMATRLYVGNLAPNTTEAQIIDLFKASGNVVSCKIIMDKVTNTSKGFAFVEMGSEAEAAKAMADCNGKELDGRALKVNEAQRREERPMKT